jgi:hypothetical protein
MEHRADFVKGSIQGWANISGYYFGVLTGFGFDLFAICGSNVGKQSSTITVDHRMGGL